MQGIWLRLRGLWYGGQENGQTMAEYALVLLLVAMAVIIAVGLLGTQIANFYEVLQARFTAL
ncbi:MAG: Flp family type IVb pilin [Anaerolineae bacterium]